MLYFNEISKVKADLIITPMANVNVLCAKLNGL